METKIKLGLTIGLLMMIIGFCLWSDTSFTLIGFGVVIIGNCLLMIIHRNNK